MTEYTGREEWGRDIDIGKNDHGENLSSSLDPNAGGSYADKPIWDLTTIASNLNRTGNDWKHNNYGELNDGILNFGFWNSLDEVQNSYYTNATGTSGFNEANPETFSAFNEAQRDGAREAIGLWDDLIAISFRETKSGAADITYGNTDTGGAQAYAYLPFGNIYDDYYAALDFEEVGRISGDVWIDGFVPSNFFPLANSYYSITTLIHETGHALGLSHPGSYDALDDNDGDGVPDPITYGNDAFYAQDSLQYSIMSYFDGYETGAQFIDFSLLNFAYPSTPMIHDIAAIQKIYGADMTTRTGDTVYGFNSTADRAVYDFSLNTRPIISIWDAGGNDTLDFSGWNTDSIIDLNAGGFSSGGGTIDLPTIEEVNANRAEVGLGARDAETYQFYVDLLAQLGVTSGLYHDNISIAYGATIENAVGGGGNDLLIANEVANRLDGRGGSDTVSYETAKTAVQVSLAAGTALGGAAGDVLLSIENLKGSAFNDALSGNGGANTLEGGKGNDQLRGNGGTDKFVFSGDTGHDRIYDFGAGDVLVTDAKIADGNNDGIITFGKDKLLRLDGGTDSVQMDGVRSLRYLGSADGQYYYGDSAARPTAGSKQKVFEGTVGDDTLTGKSGSKSVFFFDTALNAPTGDDIISKLNKTDIIVTTTKLADNNNDNRIQFGGDGLDLGNGGSVAIAGTTSLEFDGQVLRGGVTYYVYSALNSSAGLADLHF